MGNLLKVPHIKQPKNSPKCGAACAAMLIEYYTDKKVGVDAIWPFVKAISPELNREYCRTNKIGQYISNHHFPCCIVKYENLKDFLIFCNTNEIAPILNHKSFSDGTGGHFSVVKNISNNTVIINDPEKKGSVPVQVKILAALSHKDGRQDEVGGNTAIVSIMEDFADKSRPCPDCGNPIDTSFSTVANANGSIVLEELCFHCDKYFPLEVPTTNAHSQFDD